MIYLFQYIDNCDKSAEATIEEPAALDAFVQARISYEIHEPNNGTKLSPFPSMCDWCRRRKSTNQKCRKKSNDINMTNQNNDHKKSVLNGNPAQMDNDMEKDGISVSESVAVNLEQKVDTSQVLDIKPMKTASHRNKIITSKHLERDVVSNQRSSLLENNSETNNSHLMRDRNSNYYSLQSRNGNNIRASSSDRQTHTCILAVNQRSNTKNTAPTSLNKGFDNEIVDVESNIPDHRGDEMENHDVSTFNLAFDSDSEMETETEGESNMVAVHNEDMNNHKDVDEVDRLELVSKPNHLTIHDQQTFTKVRKDVIQGKQSEIVSKSKHQGPHKLQSKSSTGIKESGTRNNVDNVNHGQVEDNIPTASNTGMTNKVPIACVSPCVSSEKRIESNREIELNAVKNCPLCQMEFARR